MSLVRTRLAGGLGCALALGALASCSSVRTDEGLAMLDVTASADTPPFTTARFSVAGLPAIPAHEVAYDGRSTLKFGYYLPGPNGVVRVTGQALSASCVVGIGTAAVTVELGHVSPAVPLVINPVSSIDPACERRGGRVGRRAGGRARRRPFRRARRRSARRRAGHGRAHRRTDDAPRFRPAGLPGGDQGMHQLDDVLLGAHLWHDLARSGLLRQLRGAVHAARWRGLLRAARVHQRRLLSARDVLVHGDVVLHGTGLRHHQPWQNLLRQRRRPVHPPRRRRLLRRAQVRRQRLREVSLGVRTLRERARAGGEGPELGERRS